MTSQVTGVFRCRRCRTEQRITRERWLDTVTFVHGDSTQDPHPVSVVKASQLPRHSDPCPICNTFQARHFPNGQNGPPQPVVDVGKPGLNQPGDSVL